MTTPPLPGQRKVHKGGFGIRFRGWPRKKVAWIPSLGRRAERYGNEVKLPNLWIGGKNQQYNDWTSFEIHRSAAAKRDHLCVVCGEALFRYACMGTMFREKPETNGPPAHPRCMWIAAQVCPHFQDNNPEDDTIIAYLWDGYEQEWGYKHDDSLGEPFVDDALINPECRALLMSELKELARENPLGVGH